MLSSFFSSSFLLSTLKASLILFVAHKLPVPLTCCHHHSVDLAPGVTWDSLCSSLVTGNSLAPSGDTRVNSTNLTKKLIG